MHAHTDPSSAGLSETIGVDSGQVMTVLGPIPIGELGITLMHEHVFVDASSWWQEPEAATRKQLAHQPISMDIIGELRMDPFVNLDNCKLLDFDAAVDELMQFHDLSGVTVVDASVKGIGRDPLALQRVSRRTELNIIMGAGYYLEPSHPPYVRERTADDIAEEIVRDLTEGVDGTRVRSGIIGEIGVSAQFTDEERKVLRGAARAAARAQTPLTIHLPGWERLAHDVLDVVEEEGANLAHTILCHMNPSLSDFEYQTSLADRGAFIEYDMIGMDYYYADQDAQSPCDKANAMAIKRLIDAGYLNQILISQDVFLKMMLTRYGGWGYGYILRHFVPRLRRHGVMEEEIDILLTENPRRVFSAKHRSGS